MSETIRWSDLVHPQVAPELALSLVTLGGSAYAGGYFFSAGQYGAVAVSLLAIIGWLPNLGVVDERARALRRREVDA